MYELLIHLPRQLASRSTTVNEMAVERKRQAQVFLKKERRLLSKGLTDEADVRLGLALCLWPDIVDSLSKRQQRMPMTELARLGGGPNATYLWLDLDKRQSKSP